MPSIARFTRRRRATSFAIRPVIYLLPFAIVQLGTPSSGVATALVILFIIALAFGSSAGVGSDYVAAPTSSHRSQRRDPIDAGPGRISHPAYFCGDPRRARRPSKIHPVCRQFTRARRIRVGAWDGGRDPDQPLPGPRDAPGSGAISPLSRLRALLGTDQLAPVSEA